MSLTEDIVALNSKYFKFDKIIVYRAKYYNSNSSQIKAVNFT